jgi:hypothetical protein
MFRSKKFERRFKRSARRNQFGLRHKLVNADSSEIAADELRRNTVNLRVVSTHVISGFKSL